MQELGRAAGIVNKQNPVLCKPSKHVSRAAQRCNQHAGQAAAAAVLVGVAQTCSRTPPPIITRPPQVYQLVLQQLEGACPANTIFVDDSIRNIRAAHELGIFTVLVSDAPGGPPGHPHHVPGADLVVSHFRELPSVLPELFADAAEHHEEAPAAGVPVRVMAS